MVHLSARCSEDADCLSRLPLDIDSYITECKEEVNPDSFRAIMAGANVQVDQKETWRVQLAELNVRPHDMILLDGLEKISPEKIVALQKEDKDIGVVYLALENGEPVPKELLTKNVKNMWYGRKKLFIDEKGRLKRRSGETSQLVLPQVLRPLIYQHLHIDMGHLGARVFEFSMTTWHDLQFL